MTFHINPVVPEIWCSDFEVSLAFYTEILGLAIAQQRNRDPHACLSLGGSQIMLAYWTSDGIWEPCYPAPMERPCGREINFHFLVADVTSLHDRVMGNGVAPFMALQTSTIWRTDRMDERGQFMLLDPDSYLLRFVQITSHRAVELADIEKLDS
ncbi:MAG: VOC family protein, partial [Hyphomicrobiaceae bacterium]